MPLVVMCGIPGSGKTRKAWKIKRFLEEVHKKRVEIVAEEQEAEHAGFHKETFYVQPHQEKVLRSALRSQVMKLLDADNVVILDAGNYIKGYRYELYCGSKSVKSTQCTVYTLCNIDEARHNSTLPLEVFNALVDRFEEPSANNRWDSPLVVWGDMEDEKEENALQEIYAALYQRAPPPPNMSTQNAPLSDTNYLQRMDEVTREVCDRAARGLIPELSSDSPPAPPQLSRMRRQFLTYAKMNLSNTPPQDIAHLFTQYLVTTFK